LFRYSLYDCILDSSYEFPSVSRYPQRGRGPDIELVDGAGAEDRTFAAAEAAVRHPRRWFQYVPLPDGSDYLRWHRFFACLISPDGRLIISRSSQRVSAETLETYLLGQILSFALLKQGVESLHATTIAVEGRAIALFGDCGMGKSTLAAACLAAGYSLLTDDLLVVKPQASSYLAFPGPPRLKLMPSTANRLFGTRGGCCMNPLTTKRILPLARSQHVKIPLPMRACYDLRLPRAMRRSGVEVQRLPARLAWRVFTQSTFNVAVRDPARLQRQFAWAGSLAESIPVYALSYPMGMRILPEVVRAIASTVPS
jgi:hypothetical protein